jgi:formylglycine-generating enzyme required for sulfatase activity
MENLANTKRYPGSVPFEKKQKDLFFGRESDSKALYKFINVNKLTVLYGKSGLGKTSLLNAGLYPLLEAEGYMVVPIRFNSYSAKNHTTPRNIFIQKIKEYTGENIFLSGIESEDHNISLWQYFKALEWKFREKQGILAVFDQFEEIFTYPQGVEDFGKEYAELQNNRMPDFFQRKLYQKINDDPDFLDKNAEMVDFIEQQRNLRVVLSLRSDRMSLLNRLTPWLPTILKNCYELLPLTRQQAENAIVLPAQKQGNFISKPFEFHPESIERILSYLSENNQKSIESFQLQVLCQHLENLTIEKNLSEIKPDLLGDIEQVYQNFYGSILRQFHGANVPIVQRFIEDGLIFEEDERRLSLYEGQIYSQWGIKPEMLSKLVDTHLVRAEPNPQGGLSYELCHDSMVNPILNVKKVRKQAEQQAAFEAERRKQEATDQEERERLRAENELAEKRRRRAALYALGSILLAIMAMLFGFYAWQQRTMAFSLKQQADEQRSLAESNAQKAIDALHLAEAERKNADQQKNIANENAALALSKSKEAKRNFELASQNLEKAKIEEGKALNALELVKLEKAATEEARMREGAERKRAEENYLTAQTKAKEAEEQRDKAQKILIELGQATDAIVETLLNDFKTAVDRLNYERASSNLKSVLPFEKRTKEVANGFMEIAFYENEIGRIESAKSALLQACELYKNDTLRLILSKEYGKQAITQGLSQLDKSYFLRLNNKYFPEIIPVIGGEFQIGCNPSDDVDCSQDAMAAGKIILKAFSMGRTEITFWQFALYCEAQKLKITNFSPGSWDVFGDNPVVNVSWFDAAKYTNWLNNRFALDSVYVFNTDGSLNNIREGINGVYRLPTEAEWEYAAKGAQNQYTPFSGGIELSEVGFFIGNANERTRPVGVKKANTLGLHDMSGNVQEWCQDWYGLYPKQTKTNPIGPKSGDARVVRGGSFGDPITYCKVNYRRKKLPSGKGEETGFRVVR